MATTSSTVAPQGTPGPIYVDTQHEDLVHDAQLDYYGCKLATSSSGEWIAFVYQVSMHKFQWRIPYMFWYLFS